MKQLALIALAFALLAIPAYFVKHHQPTQVAGPPGTTNPCPPLCISKPIATK